MLESFCDYPQMLFGHFLDMDFMNLARWYLMHLVLYGISKGDFQYLSRYSLVLKLERLLTRIFGRDFVINYGRAKFSIISQREVRGKASAVPPHVVVMDDEPSEKLVQCSVLKKKCIATLCYFVNLFSRRKAWKTLNIIYTSLWWQFYYVQNWRCYCISSLLWEWIE